MIFEAIEKFYRATEPHLREKEWHAIKVKLTIQYLKKGEVLCRQGEISQSVHFINCGVVRKFCMVNGKDIPVGSNFQ